MSEFIIKGKNIRLIGDPVKCTYSVEIGSAVWHQTERPFVRFSDGTVVPFPSPAAENTFNTGTTEGISAEYRDFGTHNVVVKTSAEIETHSDDVYFTLTVSGDDRCEIEKVSFPAPFDFGKAHGDIPAAGKNNLPRSYTVLPRMQGTLIPAGTKISSNSA